MSGAGSPRSSQRPSARRLHRRSPRPLAKALDGLATRLEPATTLARVQRCWPRLVTALPAAAEGTPVALRDGTLTIACTASVYAHELHLIADDLTAALNGALGEEVVNTLRVRTA
jgi:predicted nucleic acid-binding Zn ribbon protein